LTNETVWTSDAIRTEEEKTRVAQCNVV